MEKCALPRVSTVDYTYDELPRGLKNGRCILSFVLIYFTCLRTRSVMRIGFWVENRLVVDRNPGSL